MSIAHLRFDPTEYNGAGFGASYLEAPFDRSTPRRDGNSKFRTLSPSRSTQWATPTTGPAVVSPARNGPSLRPRQRESSRAQQSGIELAGPDSEGPALINDLQIAFNGLHGAACEPFKLSRTASRGFCKTQHLPYDAVVVAVLIAAEATGALTWTSDGKAADHEVGKKLAEGIA